MPNLVRPDLITDEVSEWGALLELVHRRPGWHADAACKEAPAGVWWFPEVGQSAEPAKEICRRCQARDDCLAWSLEQGSDLHGIFGGLSKRDRACRRQERPAA